MSKQKTNDEQKIKELQKIEKYKQLTDEQAQEMIEDIKLFCKLVVRTALNDYNMKEGKEVRHE